jgi:hypothetical protein
MARRSASRRLLIGLAMLTLGALPGTAAAFDLPPDAVADGTVTVVVSDPLSSGAPLGAMTVTLTAIRTDLPGEPIIQQLIEPADAGGTAMFTGVARPADGAPPVDIEVAAVAEQPNDCGGTDRWTGNAAGSGGLAVEIALAISSGTSSCAGRTIAGRVVDAAGEPFQVASAEAIIDVEGMGTDVQPVAVDPEGGFVILLEGDPDAATSVSLLVLGQVTRETGTDPDCELEVMEVAEATWDLPPFAPLPEPLTIVSERVVLTEVCGTLGTPGPAVTLPPTDADVAGMAGVADAPGAVGTLMALAGIALLALAAVLWHRRRPVTTD